MNERGFTLVELLVTAAIGVVVLLGLGSLYVSALRFGHVDDSLTYMQRQGSLILDEMGRQIRAGTEIKCSPAACDPAAVNPPSACGVDPSLQVTVSPHEYCFRLDADAGNQLIEVRPEGPFNMLTGSPAPLTVSACPGIPMFRLPPNPFDCSPGGTPCSPANQVEICFQLSTTSTAPDSMIFRASFTKRN